MLACAIAVSTVPMHEADLGLKVFPAVSAEGAGGSTLLVSWKPPDMVQDARGRGVLLRASVLQKKKGKASTWEDVPNSTQNAGRIEAKVTAAMDEDLHFRVLVHTQQEDCKGAFEFDVLCSSSTCTKQDAATSLNLHSTVTTGSSIVLRWTPRSEVTRQGDDLRMHGDSPLKIYLRRVPEDPAPSRTGSASESHCSVVDDEEVEAGKDTHFKPVASDRLEVRSGRTVRLGRAHLPAYGLAFSAALYEQVHSPQLVELTGLGQSVAYQARCVIKMATSATPLFVITPSVSAETRFGDAEDFYSKRKLGEGSYASVFKGWHLNRGAMPQWTSATPLKDMQEDRAIKVFGLKAGDAEDDAFTYWNHEKQQLDLAKVHAGRGADCLIKFYPKVRSALCSPPTL